MPDPTPDPRPLGPSIIYTAEEAQALWQRGYDAGAAARATVSAGPEGYNVVPLPLPIHDCPCGACDYLRRKQAEERRWTLEAARPVSAGDDPLAAFSEDEVMYDYPFAQSGEPMDPVLYVEWDAIHRHGYRLTPKAVSEADHA